MVMYRLPGIHFYMLPLLYYNDNELQQRYRFGRNTIEYITRLLHDHISPMTNCNHSVSATQQVLITLRFLASGSFQQVTGDSVAGLDSNSLELGPELLIFL